MISRFLKAGFATKYPLSSLKVLLSGGAILTAKTQEELKRVLPHVPILQIYGMTEACGLTTMQFPWHKMGSCGTVIPNYEIKIVDLDNGETLGPNQTGEIFIRSAITMTGWMHSGDIGYIDADGELYIVDRLKDLIKYRGYQISPAEVEVLLHTHPGVLVVAVVGVPHPIDMEHPVAFVDAQTDKVVTYAELQNKVVRCALWLQEHGIKSGDVISICSNNHLDSIVPYLAATYINAIFNGWYEKMDLRLIEVAGMITLQLPWHKIGSCGTVTQNGELKIIDPDNGKTLGPNQTGEICIKSATIMNGWLHSGDVGYIDADGELYIVDKLKDLIKYRGVQVSSAEIEILLHTHPGVLEVAVMGVPHPTDDEHPVAYVTIKPGFTVTEKELVDLVAKNMTDAFRLRAGVVFLDTFPHLGCGRLAKNELKAMAKKLAVKEADD
ncbi:4-coumarate--CoA ligase-like protein [Ooceraea biroi]|uniref:4-coumarate--CoA ligase-like protein n=1 Tax=Ooceraea biroi TaxID=2015173 RepID=A0A026WJM1_OOCBI|nr:4-coumarate--CoA ligase-like protein [Ooceraea biroi]